ncbi:MAG: hypothetical protein K6B74_01680, partial [Ruminococcus sp.]|nr:hypothetical protein [Ruminococcus sp.]
KIHITASNSLEGRLSELRSDHLLRSFSLYCEFFSRNLYADIFLDCYSDKAAATLNSLQRLFCSFQTEADKREEPHLSEIHNFAKEKFSEIKRSFNVREKRPIRLSRRFGNIIDFSRNI